MLDDHHRVGGRISLIRMAALRTLGRICERVAIAGIGDRD
jgi:hypothetical protein